MIRKLVVLHDGAWHTPADHTDDSRLRDGILGCGLSEDIRDGCHGLAANRHPPTVATAPPGKCTAQDTYQ